MRPTARSALLQRRQRNLERIARSVNEANLMLKQFTDHPADTYQLLLRLAGQIAFESALAPARKSPTLQNHTVIEFTRFFMAARRRHRAARKSFATRRQSSAGDA